MNRAPDPKKRIPLFWKLIGAISLCILSVGILLIILVGESGVVTTIGPSKAKPSINSSNEHVFYADITGKYKASFSREDVSNEYNGNISCSVLVNKTPIATISLTNGAKIDIPFTVNKGDRVTLRMETNTNISGDVVYSTECPVSGIWLWYVKLSYLGLPCLLLGFFCCGVLTIYLINRRIKLRKQINKG